MTTTPDFLTAKMPHGNLATAVMFQLFFVGLVNLLLTLKILEAEQRVAKIFSPQKR